MASLTYSQLTGWRGECAKFGSLWSLPISFNQYATIKQYDRGGRVLDVGAGVHHQLKSALKIDDARYFSLDDDPSGKFSFSSFEAIPPELKFDLVTMLQILEHLTIDVSHTLVREAFNVLAPGGILFISVPNSYHPIRYHTDATHETNWNFQDLYGLLRHVGFEVRAIVRSNKYKPSRNPLTRWLMSSICKQFRVDWCDTMLLIAARPAQSKA